MSSRSADSILRNSRANSILRSTRADNVLRSSARRQQSHVSADDTSMRSSHKPSSRRVSILIEEHDHGPNETYTFTLGDPINDDSTHLGDWRNRCGKFINNFYVQIIMTGCIIGNAILLGALTVESVKNDPALLNALNWLDRAFLIAFSIEFLLQFFYLGPTFLRHTWLTFDFVIITFSWAFIGSSAGVLRSFRIFRILSLVSKWKSMQDLVTAVGHTVPRLASIFICLLLIFYVYAVLCTSLYIDLYDEGHLNWPYFERLDYAFITLFQFMTLDSWHGVVRQVQEVRPWSWLCFYSFAILTAFVVLNLIVAVVCEAVVELNATKAKEKNEIENKALIDAAPVDDMVEQQTELLRSQLDLEKTLDLIMKRIPQSM